MEGNKELNPFHLTSSQIVKKVVLSQSSFALLATDTCDQIYLSKRREPSRHLSGRQGRMDVGRKGVCDRKFSTCLMLSLHARSVSNLTRTDHRKHRPQAQNDDHKHVLGSKLPSAMKPRSSSRERFLCTEEEEEAPHTKGSALYGLSTWGGNAVIP